MKKMRRRVSVCLFLVMVVAVAVGVLYYYGETRQHTTITEGTLISNLGLDLSQLFR